MNHTYLATRVAIFCIATSSWNVFGANTVESPDIILKNHIEAHGLKPLELNNVTKMTLQACAVRTMPWVGFAGGQLRVAGTLEV